MHKVKIKMKITQSLENFHGSVETLFTDIDGTLTHRGLLPDESYSMLWKLHNKGIQVVPVTGRSAGWCEMIARLWPVDGVIGENGAFYFRYKNKKMEKVFAFDETTRLKHQKKLQALGKTVLREVKGTAVASDQFTRLFDLAIDFCEDVKPLEKEEINKIVKIFEKGGATAKVSSIHVNAWFGDYNKRTMCETFYKNHFGKNLKDHLETCAFIGDSPNDEPLFSFFKNSFAVANILDFKEDLLSPPRFVTPSKEFQGFVELGQVLLKTQS